MQTEGGLRYWALKQNNETFGKTIIKMRKVGAESYEQLEYLIEQNKLAINTLKSDINLVKNDYKVLLQKKQKLKKLDAIFRVNSTQNSPSNSKYIDELKEELLVNFGLDIVSENCLKLAMNNLLNKQAEINQDLTEKNGELNSFESFIRELDEMRTNYTNFREQRERNLLNITTEER